MVQDIEVHNAMQVFLWWGRLLSYTLTDTACHNDQKTLTVISDIISKLCSYTDVFKYLTLGSAPYCSSIFKQRVFFSVSLPTAKCIADTPLLPTRSGRAPWERRCCTDLPRKRESLQSDIHCSLQFYCAENKDVACKMLRLGVKGGHASIINNSAVNNERFGKCLEKNM